MREYEYKLLLNKDDYSNILTDLIERYNKYDEILHINYYFDTKDNLFHRNDITFRVRQKEETLYLEIKTPVKKENNLSIKNEISKRISSFKEISKEIKNIELPFQSYCDITLLGTLVTERIKFIVNDKISIEMDKSFYLGKTDYEIEIEFDSENQEIAEKLFDNLSLKVMNRLFSPGGKRERFFIELLSQNDVF